MFRQAIILLSILLISCDKKSDVHFQWGCDPPCKAKKWLTFPYDKAILFHDTTGKLLKALADKNIADYIKQNKGTPIKERNIKSLDESLSCKMWTCGQDTIKRQLFSPTDIITFIKADKIVGFVVPCNKSKLVFCFPDSDNKDSDLFDTLISRILSDEE